MVITEDVHPTIGEVIWVWSDMIRDIEDRKGHRLFYIKGTPIRVTYDEVPLSVHHKEGRAVGLMLPKVLAGLNGIHANT